MIASSLNRSLFEAIDDDAFVYNEFGHVLEVNPAACRRLGYTRDKLLQLTILDIYDRKSEQTGPQGESRRKEAVLRTKDGRPIHVDISTANIPWQGESAYLDVCRDITHQRQTQEMLSKQTQLLQSILDNMSDGIVVADAQGQIVLFNPLAEKLFGPGLVQGAYALYRADQQTLVDENPIARCARGESFDGLELFIRHEEAAAGLCMSVAGRPLREGTILKGGVIVCNDITERKRRDRYARANYEVARIIAEDQDSATSARANLHALCDVFDFDVGILWQATPGANVLACLGAWQNPQASVGLFLMKSQICPLDDSADLAANAFRSALARVGSSTDGAWVSSSRCRAARHAGLQSAVACPIFSGAETIGVLEFWSLRVVEPDDARLAAMHTMANQIGQFLDRKRVEKELRDTQALYVSLVQSLPQNIFRKDRAGRVTFGNERYCASLKMPLSRLLGKTDFDLFPADVARKYVADDQRIMQTGRALDTIEEHVLPDGSQIFVHVVKTPVYDAEHEVVGVQGIFWDVTQEVVAQQSIARSEKRYRQLAEAAMDAIVVIDAHGNVALFNPAAERIFGYRAAEAIGTCMARYMPDVFSADGSMTRMVIGKAQECNARHKDGHEFPVEIALCLVPESGDSGTMILATIRDLTERNKMRSVLMQNEKLASIGLLSAGVAHEINNPLAFVANNLAVMRRDCDGLLRLIQLYESVLPAVVAAEPGVAEQIKSVADEIDLPYVHNNFARILTRTSDGIERVARIVHSLRGMARTDAPKRQDVRLPDLINSSLEILHGKFKHAGIVVEQEHDPNPVVPGVPTQISQVILNLLVNAYQAVAAARKSGGHIVVRSQRVGEDMHLEISDNGPGIRPEHLPRLFDPFFTTKDVGEGTGLGLSISHHIIAAHGGRIEVESRVGEGTCFRVVLPVG